MIFIAPNPTIIEPSAFDLKVAEATHLLLAGRSHEQSFAACLDGPDRRRVVTAIMTASLNSPVLRTAIRRMDQTTVFEWCRIGSVNCPRAAA